MANTTYLFGVDVGGTTVKIGLFESDGTLLEKWEIVTRKENSGANVLPDIADSVCERIGTHDISFSDIPGIGIGVPGAVTERAVVARLVNVGWGRVDVAADFKKLILDRMNAHHTKEGDAFRVKVANDANVAALGELWKGAGVGCKSLMMVTLGTGIGGAFILNGSVLRGHTNSACELGYLHVPGGTLDRRGSARGMVMSVAERKGEKADSWNGRKVFQEAEKGDIICMDAIREMADILGHSIADLCYVLNPEVVVLGGGIMQQETILLPLIRKSMDAYLLPGIAEHTELRAAQYRNNAGMLGAYCHFSARNKEC